MANVYTVHTIIDLSLDYRYVYTCIVNINTYIIGVKFSRRLLFLCMDVFYRVIG